MSKRFIYIAGFGTLFGLGGAGLLIQYFLQHKSFDVILIDLKTEIIKQILIAIAYSAIALVVLLFLLQKNMLDATRHFFAALMQKYAVSYNNIIFLSFCAGIGEEMLFRGAIQTWLGVWLTAVIFIFLHGYLNPKDKPLFIYGIVLLVVSAGFGYLMQFFGLTSAILAHALIDIGLMIYLLKSNLKPQ